MSTALRQGYLLIADISGYTSYLAKTELDHAHEIISDLLEIISGKIQSLLNISKYEGDAVFAFVDERSIERPELLLELVEDTYAAFRRRIDASNRRTLCLCNACQSMSTLDLKFFLHKGAFVLRKIGNSFDLIGHDVNLIHRLTKNSLSKTRGWRGYMMMTRSALSALSVMNNGMISQNEEYEDVGNVETFAADLHPQYEALLSRRLYVLDEQQAHHVFRAKANAPASLVWEWLHNPKKRAELQKMTIVAAKRIDGRMKQGAVNHCIHGKEMIVEEIIDWKPFEYWSLSQKGNFGEIHDDGELKEENGVTAIRIYSRLDLKYKFLSIFSRPLMKFLARIYHIDEMITTMIRFAEEEWKMKNESVIT